MLTKAFWKDINQVNCPGMISCHPPEVMAIAEVLPAGRVLDIGCGFGRTAIYMSQKGWQATGVDYVPKAIENS